MIRPELTERTRITRPCFSCYAVILVGCELNLFALSTPAADDFVLTNYFTYATLQYSICNLSRKSFYEKAILLQPLTVYEKENATDTGKNVA